MVGVESRRCLQKQVPMIRIDNKLFCRADQGLRSMLESIQGLEFVWNAHLGMGILWKRVLNYFVYLPQLLFLCAIFFLFRGKAVLSTTPKDAKGASQPRVGNSFGYNLEQCPWVWTCEAYLPTRKCQQVSLNCGQEVDRGERGFGGDREVSLRGERKLLLDFLPGY